MSSLRSLPFVLEQGDLIVVTVSAKNEIGWGPVSNPNTVGVNV